MSLKTIFITLILGSSSVALAQPTVRDHRVLDTPSITISGGVAATAHDPYGRFAPHVRYDRNDRFANDRYDRDRRSDWNRWNRRHDRDNRSGGREILLAPASQMSLTNDGNASHALDQRVGRLMSIELDGFGGPQYIDYVVLHRANGRSQRIEVNRRLDARYGQLTIALGQRGARLRAISVYGSSPTRTGLQITGMLR